MRRDPIGNRITLEELSFSKKKTNQNNYTGTQNNI